MGLRFEWDEDKARQNIEKHGISFEEAAAVFMPNAAMLFASSALVGQRAVKGVHIRNEDNPPSHTEMLDEYDFD
jgi:uncharacterized DUF497 family protein